MTQAVALTPKELARIVSYYRAGVTVRLLKKQFQLSQTSLYRILRAHGVELRKVEST